MSMVGKTFKQKMAAFLAVCMVASALPTGPVFAAEEPKEESSAASLVEFDVEKLKEAVEKAVKKDTMVTPPTVVASASVASFDTSSYELSGAEGLLKDGTKLPEDTDLRIFLVPDDLGYDADNTYTVTGSESLIFMLENKGDEEQGYQLVFGNKITDVIEVKSKAQLLQEYELGEEETQTETTAATPSNADSIQEGQIAPENESQAQTQTEADSERNAQSSEQAAAPQESISEDSIQEGQVAPENETTAAETETAAEDAEETEAKAEESQAGETEAETSRETEAQETEKEETRAESEEKEPIVISNPEKEDDKEEASQVTIGKIFDMLTGSIVAYGAQPEITATPSDASQEDKLVADVPGTSEPVKETPETSAPAESVAVETTEAEPEETTMVPAAEAAVPEQTAEKASPSNATEAEETVDRTFEGATDGYVKLNAEISASTLIMRKDSFEKEEVTGILKPMARVMSLFAGDDTEDETKVTASSTRAVAFAAVPLVEVLADSSEVDSKNFQLTLYDYNGQTYGQSDVINSYLKNKNLYYTEGRGPWKKDYYFKFGGGNSEEVNRYQYQSGWNEVAQNIYQGIPDKEWKSNFLSTVFPESQGNISESAIKVYPDVEAKLFQMSADGYYYFDSGERIAYYNETEDALLSKDIPQNLVDSVENYGGFWIFDGGNQVQKNDLFGMHLSFDFYKPAGGMVGDEPMVFEFSGDDDVWVYLTKKNPDGTEEKQLVLDIGGVHGRMDGTIDFSRGLITYSNENAKVEKERNAQVIYNIDDSGSKYSVEWDGYNPDEEAEYTLDLYYLERGSYASNCKMRFNLPMIPGQGVTLRKNLEGKTWETGDSYQFNVVHSTDLKALGTYREGGNENSDVESETVTLSDSLVKTIESIAADEYFYIEEVKPEDTNHVMWRISVNSEESEVSPEEGYEDTVSRTTSGQTYVASPIYKMPEQDTGFLFTCTNRYGQMTPEYAKRAWKDYTVTESGKYDITLEVTGAEMTGTTSSEGTQPIDLVVVIDKSGSMKTDWSFDTDPIDAIKEAISNRNGGEDIISQLPAGSHLSIVAYSDDDIGWSNKNYKTYGAVINQGDSTYYEASDWVEISENSQEARNTVNTFLYGRFGNDGIQAGGGTHTAGGIVGANVKLRNEEIAQSSNPKAVILMTDGEPTYAIDRDGNRIGSGGSTNNTIKNLTDAQFESLKNMNQDGYQTPSIYAIGYGNNVDYEWLENSDWLDGYKTSSSINDLIEDMIEMAGSASTLTKLKNVVVTDQLDMRHITLESWNVPTGDGSMVTLSVPQLYLVNGKVAGTGNSEGENPKVTVGKEAELDAVYYSETQIVEYRDSSDKLVAQYFIVGGKVTGNIGTYNELEVPANTIVWYVGESYGATQTTTLVYGVTAKESSEEMVTGDSDTGTHRQENTEDNQGYRSNVEAKLYYDDGTSATTTETFKHPVVVPVVAKRDLTIKKVVEGIETGDEVNGVYKFSVKFGNGEKLLQEQVPSGAVWNESEKEYTFELENGEEITFSDIPVETEFTVNEDVAESNTGNTDYVVTKVEAKQDNGTPIATAEDDIRPDELQFSGKIPKEDSTVTFTNTLDKYGYIEVDKNVIGGSENEKFKFQVTLGGEPYDIGTSEEGVFELAAVDENYKIKIQPEDLDEEFLIKEIDTKGAWRTTVAKNSESATDAKEIKASSGDKVIFTNYYFAHSITIAKEIDGEELLPDAKYTFIVDFEVRADQTLQKDNLTVKVADVEVTDLKLEDNRLTVEIKAGESVEILDLPQFVTGYKITEVLPSLAPNADYSVGLETITAESTNGAIDTNIPEMSAEHVFTAQEDQSDEITYVNRYSYLYGTLVITKRLQNTVASEDTVFTFKVTNTTTGEVFFTTVKVPDNTDSGSVTLDNIPIGTYAVEELDSTIRYEIDGEKVVTGIVVTVDNQGKAEFTNKKTGDSYFSDISTVVNAVINGKFDSDPDVEPLPISIQQTASALEMNAGAYLLPEQLKKQSGEDDVIQPA